MSLLLFLRRRELIDVLLDGLLNQRSEDLILAEKLDKFLSLNALFIELVREFERMVV